MPLHLRGGQRTAMDVDKVWICRLGVYKYVHKKPYEAGEPRVEKRSGGQAKLTKYFGA